MFFITLWAYYGTLPAGIRKLADENYEPGHHSEYDRLIGRFQ